MNDVMPDPLPKCFCPERSQVPSSPGLAVALVLATSPPLPGSEVIVPNHAPLLARAVTDARCWSQAAPYGSGAFSVASQYDSTAGCIEHTSATEGSPRARVRRISAIGRVERLTVSNRPP
jgi:hypothetical protein